MFSHQRFCNSQLVGRIWEEKIDSFTLSNFWAKLKINNNI